MNLKSLAVTVAIMAIFSTGLALAQIYPVPYITLFSGTAPVQAGNSAIGGTFGAGTTNPCSATSGVPCSGEVNFQASGTSTAATGVAVPAACAHPVLSRTSADGNTTGSYYTTATSSPYPNTLVVTKVYPTAAPTATADVNFNCN